MLIHPVSMKCSGRYAAHCVSPFHRIVLTSRATLNIISLSVPLEAAQRSTEKSEYSKRSTIKVAYPVAYMHMQVSCRWARAFHQSQYCTLYIHVTVASFSYNIKCSSLQLVPLLYRRRGRQGQRENVTKV